MGGLFLHIPAVFENGQERFENEEKKEKRERGKEAEFFACSFEREGLNRKDKIEEG